MYNVMTILNTTLCTAVTIVIVMLFTAGCASMGSSYTYTVIESDFELVFSHKYRSLVLIRANGQDAFDMAESETTVISPRFSPDGNMIAFYDLGSSSGLPISSRAVSLVIFDLGWEGDPEEAFAAFPLEQFDTDHRLIVDDAIPPLWAPDGNSVYVAHNSGIERIDISGNRQDVVLDGKTRAVAVTRSGDRVIYSDGGNIFVLDTNTGISRPVLETDFVPQFGNRYIGALALSPGGNRLVFAMGHELFMLDIATREIHPIHEAANRVYWLAWVPDRDEILFLSGREFGGRAGFSPWMHEVDGKYRLYSITSEGEEPFKLFSENRLDVRQAVPDLSPDGRFVSLTARGGAVKEVVLVAVDGSGVSLLTFGGPNAYAAWRPVPERSLP
jgi:Tol biopolymer transport system component